MTVIQNSGKAAVLFPSDLAAIPKSSLTKRIGGKALHLHKLAKCGELVPAWAVLSSDVFAEYLSASFEKELDVLAELDGNEQDPALLSAASTLRAAISQATLPLELRNELATAFTKLAPTSFIAVRSSAVDEDSAAGSFAGLHDSFLFVRDGQELAAAVTKVWASAFSDRALLYRAKQKISLKDIRIAVVLQTMIEPSVSGVIFTANPNNGDPDEAVISSIWGVGEGLVSEGLDADTFVVSKTDGAITATLSTKAEQVVFDKARGSGTCKTAVPASRQQTASLTDRQIGQLVTAGKTIENRFFRPQDIEFAFDEAGALHILQARAITTAEEFGPAAGSMLLWDNSNIIESYSGVTSPLTFSFIKRAYTIVYHCFAEVMGVSPKVVHANQQTFSNMLGLFHGQVYYNLLNWYRLIQLFPGFSFTKQYMESMMGVGQSLTGSLSPPSGVSNSKLVAGLRLLRLLGSSLWKFARIKRIASDFQEHFARHYRVWSSLDFDELPPSELMKTYYEMEDKLLWNWKAPIINDFFVMIFYGLLKKLCRTWCGDEAGTLQNSLLSGEGGIESTEPTKMLIRLAWIAQQNPALKELIEREEPIRLADTLPSRHEFSEFNALFADYLHRYGFRCMNELKLEEYSLRDRPERIFEHLKNYLGIDPALLDLSAMEAREQKVRRDAEASVESLIDERSFAFVRKLIFGWVLRCARLGVKNRENMRFARTKIYGLLRELFRAVGKQFAEQGILRETQDIFYLTVEEIWDFVRGTAVTAELSKLVEVRRNEFDGYRRNEAAFPDSRFTTWGIAYHKNRFQPRTKAVDTAPAGGLRGTGCCAGIITGPVKVIRDPSAGLALKGEILVAGRTDPGWVPLYPAAIGILIERGSILSHSAIVAREMGIPTIVGIPKLLETLKTGDIVTMNGATGEVELHTSAPPRGSSTSSGDSRSAEAGAEQVVSGS